MQNIDLALPPRSSPAISPQTADREAHSTLGLPPVTRGASEDYLDKAALASSRATADDPLNTIFEREKLVAAAATSGAAAAAAAAALTLDVATVQANVYEAALQRLRTKVQWGSFVAEAGGFAAVACWEPQVLGTGHHGEIEEIRKTRPVFADFLQKLGALEREHLHPVVQKMRPDDGKYWKLSLVARDPTQPYVAGAVRAVVAPFMKEFSSETQEGGPMPLWLAAGSKRARDVYEHFGFREVGTMDIEGVTTYAMIYTENIE